MARQVLAYVFGKGRYVWLAAVTALVTFVLATWAGNFGLIWQIAKAQGLQFSDKARILLALIGSITTNFTAFSAAATIAIAMLFGMNAAVIAYALVERRQFTNQSGQAVNVAGLGGLASGLFGIGCAACGTLLLSPALAFLGAGTIVALLPFGGEEFGALGVGLLILSLGLNIKRIGKSLQCPIPTLPESTTIHPSPEGDTTHRLSRDPATNPTPV